MMIPMCYKYQNYIDDPSGNKIELIEYPKDNYDYVDKEEFMIEIKKL